MANIDNWSQNANQKEHERAVKALEDVKLELPELETYRVGTSWIQFRKDLPEKEKEKRIRNFRRYLAER